MNMDVDVLACQDPSPSYDQWLDSLYKSSDSLTDPDAHCS